MINCFKDWNQSTLSLTLHPLLRTGSTEETSRYVRTIIDLDVTNQPSQINKTNIVLKDFKNAKNENYYFLNKEQF